MNVRVRRHYDILCLPRDNLGFSGILTQQQQQQHRYVIRRRDR